MPIVIERADGGVSILWPVSGESKKNAEAEVEKWKGCHPGQYLRHRSVEPKDIPADRSKRSLWGHDLKARKQIMA